MKIKKIQFALLTAILVISNICLIISKEIEEGIKSEGKDSDEYFINDMTEDEFIKYNSEEYLNFFDLVDGKSSYCDVCKAGIDIIKNSIFQEYTWNFLHNLFTFGCSFALRKDICYEAVGRYGPVVLESIGKRLLNKETICTSLHFCSPSIEYESYDEFAERVLKNKPKTEEIPKKFNKEDKEFTFVQIADIHLEEEYKEGTVSNCGIPLCCRQTPEELGWTNGTTPNGEPIKLAGKFGSTGDCDASIEMVTAFAEEAVKIKPDFILFTGDNSAHNVWEVTQKEIIHSTELSLKEIEKIFGKDTPIYPTIGNHEKAPPDIFFGSETILLHGISKPFRKYLTKEAYDSFSQYGYYTMIHKNTNLRIVSLNCVICDSMNFHLWGGNLEGAKMFQWLEKVLNDAEKNGEIIYLIDHIPSSSHQYVLNCSFRIKALLDRYQNIIHGYISGHTHREEMSLIHEYYDKSKLININYIAPSLTTYYEYWPSFRAYIADYKTKYIKDFIQYRFNLDESNKTGKKIWYNYNATQLFNVTTMTDIEGVRKANIDEEFVRHKYTDNPENYKFYTNKQIIENTKCIFHNDNFKDILACPNFQQTAEEKMHKYFNMFNMKWIKLPSLVNY